MRSRDIIFFGGIDWFDVRKLSVHHIVALLGKKNRVFYIDNFGGTRSLTRKDIPRILRKLKRVFGPQLGSTPKEESKTGVFVYQPLNVPSPRWPDLLGRVNVELLRFALRRLMYHYQIRSPVIWTCVPTEIVWRSIAGLEWSALVYQSVDKIDRNPMISNKIRPRLTQTDRWFSEAADLVFASARGLYDQKKKLNPRTHFFPNGVDPELFSGTYNTVSWLGKIKKPIIGFVGSLGPWIDYELIYRCALESPDWSYVLVGPLNPGVDLGGLENVSNVHLVGPAKHSELPAILGDFDCGLIPYLINDFTKYTYPSKMAEYLAAGLPVVATPLPELIPHADVVSFAVTPRETIEVIKAHLADKRVKLSKQWRKNVAIKLSWSEIVTRMEELIEDAVSSRERGSSI